MPDSEKEELSWKRLRSPASRGRSELCGAAKPKTNLEPEIWSWKPQNEKCMHAKWQREITFLFIFFEMQLHKDSEWSFIIFISLRTQIYLSSNKGAEKPAIFFYSLFESIKAKRNGNNKKTSQCYFSCNLRECMQRKCIFFSFQPQTRKSKLVFGVYLNSRTWFNYSLKMHFLKRTKAMEMLFRAGIRLNGMEMEKRRVHTRPRAERSVCSNFVIAKTWEMKPRVHWVHFWEEKDETEGKSARGRSRR